MRWWSDPIAPKAACNWGIEHQLDAAIHSVNILIFIVSNTGLRR